MNAHAQNLPERRAANREVLDTNLERQSGFLPAAFIPTSFDGVLEMAKLMAGSRNAVPPHLRDNIGACLAVSLDAYHLGVSPFALARASYTTNAEATISYEGKAIAAMVNARAGLKERLNLSWQGEGEALTCTVSGTFRGEAQPRTLEVAMRTITVRNSPLWKQQPKVQLGYWAIRAWARLYCPEVILGFHTPEEDGVMIDGTSQVVSVAAPPAPPRPSRPRVLRDIAQDPVAPSGQTLESQPAADDAEPVQEDDAPEPEDDPAPAFVLITVHGEELSWDDPEDGENARAEFVRQMKEAVAAGPEAAQGLWESNTALMQQLRAAGITPPPAPPGAPIGGGKSLL